MFGDSKCRKWRAVVIKKMGKVLVFHKTNPGLMAGNPSIPPAQPLVIPDYRVRSKLKV